MKIKDLLENFYADYETIIDFGWCIKHADGME